MSDTVKDDKIFIPGSKKNVVPFMRDVFTIPTNMRQKPNLIGSICTECEEYFFPKTGQKATCDNPLCPRSTKETMLSGRGKILSATVTRLSVDGQDERASAVILLEEGIKVNSPLLGWEGFQYLLVPGTPVEVVLQEMGETDDGNVIVGYAFRLITGRKKPQFPPAEKEPPKKASKSKRTAKESGSGAAPKKKVTKKSAKKKAAKKKTVKKKAAKKKAPKKKAARKKSAVKSRKKDAKKKAKKKAAKKKVKKTARKGKKKAQKKKSPRRKSSAKKAARKKKASGKRKAKRR